ncbi:transglycosylase SLT domain-containing protein [Maricaulis sp. MIT060901]|uniref:transglycosylase SLT domain-containing protein n=1 Tax=Maricaulis sp. MIT060901 TaxID=3096993 RepID=UPI003999959C
MVDRIENLDMRGFNTVIREAARETGADFEYLARTAARESNFDPEAQARTSSAAGMFQFIEQTWLGMMQRHGDSHGFSDLAAQIERSTDGRFEVTDSAARQQILDLRFNADAAALMAGELAAENGQIIENRVGRPATSGELYAAHFLGASGAADLIEAVRDNPQQSASHLFPAAAAANRNMFHDGARPVSAAHLLGRLTGEAERALAEAQPAGATSAAAHRHDNIAAAVPAIARSFGVMSSGSFASSGGELTPTLVEILASLDVPLAARQRDV